MELVHRINVNFNQGCCQVYYNVMPAKITIEAIVPEKNYFSKRASRLQDELVAALRGDVTLTLVGALRKRSANWSISPLWNAKVTIGARLILDLKPTGAGEKKWRWVSGGTRQHDINPKRRNWLVFGSGYVPKTLPKGTYGGKGVYIGDTVFTKHVNHPGIDARNFEQDVVDEKGDEVRGALAAAAARAVS